MITEIQKQKGTELIERKEIEGSPFTIIKKEEKCFLSMGMYRLSHDMEEDEIPIWIMENEWNIITSIAGIIAEHVLSAKDILTENKK